mgnify:CR=1 FL=1
MTRRIEIPAAGRMPNVSNFGVAVYPVKINDDKTFMLFPDSSSQELAQ